MLILLPTDPILISMKRHVIQLHGSGRITLESIGFAVEHFPHYIHTRSKPLPHGHDVLEANFIVQGTARHVIGDTERLCPPGSLGIVHYGQEHSLTTDRTGVELFNLYIDPARHAFPTLPQPFVTTAASLFPASPYPGTPRGLTSFLQFDDPAPLTQLLSYCYNEQETKAPGYEQILQSVWRILLITCARQAMMDGIETLVTNHSKWAAIESVRLMLERDYDKPHRLADLAATAGMSEAHLCRQFKLYTGLSPFAYLAQRRIQIAKQQLRSSSARILDIALASGFNDIGHFNRKFRELESCSPTYYRHHATIPRT